eukprot:g12755.t1
MRLFKPELVVEPPTVSTLFTTVGEHTTSGPISSMLALPETPGDTYLGQKFSAYIRATNITSRPVKNVKVTVEMHTPSTRVVLPDKRVIKLRSVEESKTKARNQSLLLQLDEGVDIRVEHLLTELGVHRLQVTATYTHPDKGEVVEIVKLYPVKVLRPINVTLRSREKKLDGENNLNVYVECALKNLTSSSIVLHSVEFLCKSGFHVSDLAAGKCVEKHCSYPGQEDESTSFLREKTRLNDESERVTLRPKNVQHYLFHVKSVETDDGNAQNKKEQKKTKPAIAGKKLELGKILMMWRTRMGESASLQTAPVSVSTPATVDVTLNIKSVAKNIYINEPFKVDFSVVNNASRDLCLEIMWSNFDKTFKNTGSINPLGVVGKSVQCLGVIKPSSVTACSVVFVAFKSGLHTLQDVLIKDTFTNNVYSVKFSRKVFVL